MPLQEDTLLADLNEQGYHAESLEDTDRTLSRVADTDLKGLNSKQGTELAGDIRRILDHFNYNELNSLLRSDYKGSPLPQISYEQIREDLEVLVPDHLTEQESNALRFFLLGEKVERSKLLRLFEDNEQIINNALAVGLFVVSDNEHIRLNGLAVASKTLRNGEEIYVFADTSPFLPTAMYRHRVYTGTDSYLLHDRLSELEDVKGCIVEGGSGSGLQLIALVKLNNEIDKAIGLEIDERAINVSTFNTFLNGVEKQVRIVKNPEELKKQLAGDSVSLAFSNPPFVAAPEFVEINPYDLARLPERAVVDTADGSNQVDLKSIFMKAGWGGEDGLRITNYFLDTFDTVLAEDGIIIIYSQFAGNKEGPTAVRDALTSRALSSHFELFKENCVNLNTAEWVNYVAGILSIEHPSLIGSHFLERVRSETKKMLEQNNITSMHSGFLMIHHRQGELTHTQETASGFKTFSPSEIFEQQPSLLRQMESRLAKDDITFAEDVGGGEYSAPAASAEPSAVPEFNAVFFERDLISEAADTKLRVGISGGEFIYSVSQGQSPVETGSALDGNQQMLSGRYLEVLKGVERISEVRLLRSFKFGFQRFVSSAVVMDTIGIRVPGKGVDYIEADSTNRYALESNNQAVFRGTIGDLNYLRIRAALAAEKLNKK